MRQRIEEATEDYFLHRTSQDYSKGTVRNERGVLLRFLTVNGNIYLDSVGERHVIRHFEDARKTREPASLQIDHTVLGQFFDWARKTRRMPGNTDPMMGRRRPKAFLKERTRLHVSQFDALLDAAGRDEPRDRAMMALFICLLVRDQELADLRVGDVNLDSGYVMVRISKSGKEDLMPISAELDAELRKWLTYYTEKCGVLRPHHYLIPNRRSVVAERDPVTNAISKHVMAYYPDSPVSRPSRRVQAALEAIGMETRNTDGTSKREGSHTLRRSGARALFDQLTLDGGYDHPLRIVQSMLHHASITQTEVYIGVTADKRTRDEIIRGKPMYTVNSDNVVRLTV